MNKYLKDSPNLKAFVNHAASMTLRDYSLKLNDVKPLEIDGELLLMALCKTTNKSLWADEQTFFEKLIHHPIIQTSQHISPSYGLRMTTADIIATYSLPEQSPYVIGMCSAVPLQNEMHSYALLYSTSKLNQLVYPDSALYLNAQTSKKARDFRAVDEKHINLLSVKQSRKCLTYGTTFDHQKIQQSLSNELISVLPELNTPNYCHWSIQSATSLQRNALNRKKISGVDINEWMKKYLILEYEASHGWFFSELFFSSIKRMKNIISLMNNPLILARQSSKTNQIEFLTMKDICEQGLYDRKKCEQLTLELFKHPKSVPSAFLVYTILELMYGFHCLGSFRMFEYLQTYRVGWQAILQFDNELLPFLSERNPYRLTVGSLEHIKDLPLDMKLKEKSIKMEQFADFKMRDLWSMFDV